MPASGNGAITVGRHNRDKQPDKKQRVWGIMPESTDWVSKTGKTVCAKHAWANKYGVTWDGVSNSTRVSRLNE
jgi:hypothetical protein